MVSGNEISSINFFSRLLVSMNTSIYQVNREKIYIAKSENKSSSPISCYTSFLSHLFQIDIFLNMLIQKKKKININQVKNICTTEISLSIYRKNY